MVRALVRKLKCDSCRNALISLDVAHGFIELKDRGGLTRPSSGAVTICLETERVIQRLMRQTCGRLPQGPGITRAVTTAVLTNTRVLQLFPELHHHQFDTEVEDNHVHELVKSVSSHFTRIRFYHMGKENTNAVTGEKVRQFLKRTIIFKHQ